MIKKRRSTKRENILDLDIIDPALNSQAWRKHIEELERLWKLTERPQDELAPGEEIVVTLEVGSKPILGYRDGVVVHDTAGHVWDLPYFDGSDEQGRYGPRNIPALPGVRYTIRIRKEGDTVSIWWFLPSPPR